MTLGSELVLCSGNPGKIAELHALLPREWRLLSLADLGSGSDLPETGDTLEYNALQKARFVFRHCGSPCVADDTGLEVASLGGAPGVLSARYAGPGRDPKANIAKLLREMEGRTDRRARFRTVIALVTAQGEWTFTGQVKGTIADNPRGQAGFGYDPVFIPEGHTTTFAELDPSVKNAIGHRGNAVRLLVEHLRALVAPDRAGRPALSSGHLPPQDLPPPTS